MYTRGGRAGSLLCIGSSAHGMDSGMGVTVTPLDQKIKTLPGSRPDSYVRLLRFRVEHTEQMQQVVQANEDGMTLFLTVDGRTFPLSRLVVNDGFLDLEVTYEARMRG